MQFRIAPTAIVMACAALTLVGFGCKPILDAQISTQRAAEEERPSEWVVSQPVLRHELPPTGGRGMLYLEMRTRPDSTVTVKLSGEGVLGERTQSDTAGEDGMVYLNWNITRRDRYDYDGTVAFQNTIKETFDGAYDAY